MDYFELFGLEKSFKLDLTALRRAYYGLNRNWHPDNFTLDQSVNQEEALSRTTTINEAFKILSKDDSRTKYLLGIYGVIFEEGKDIVPQSFLMEMMDVNELLMEYKMEAKEEMKEKIENQIANFEQGLKEEFENVVDRFDYQNPKEEHLNVLKTYFLKNKYLIRLKNNLDN